MSWSPSVSAALEIFQIQNLNPAIVNFNLSYK